MTAPPILRPKDEQLMKFFKYEVKDSFDHQLNKFALKLQNKFTGKPNKYRHAQPLENRVLVQGNLRASHKLP